MSVINVTEAPKDGRHGGNASSRDSSASRIGGGSSRWSGIASLFAAHTLRPGKFRPPSARRDGRESIPTEPHSVAPTIAVKDTSLHRGSQGGPQSKTLGENQPHQDQHGRRYTIKSSHNLMNQLSMEQARMITSSRRGSRRMSLSDNNQESRRGSLEGEGDGPKKPLAHLRRLQTGEGTGGGLPSGSRRATLRDVGAQVQQALRASAAGKAKDILPRSHAVDHMLAAMQAVMKGHTTDNDSDSGLSSESDRSEHRADHQDHEDQSPRSRSKESVSAPAASAADNAAKPGERPRSPSTMKPPSTSNAVSAQSSGAMSLANAVSAVLSAEQLHAAATGTPRMPGHQREAGGGDIGPAHTDMRFLAVRNARVIQQLIQEAGDDAARCHERWLRRRPQRDHNSHRASFGMKPAEERLETESKKTAARLRKRRKSAIASRLRGLPPPHEGQSFAQVIALAQQAGQGTVGDNPAPDDSSQASGTQAGESFRNPKKRSSLTVTDLESLGSNAALMTGELTPLAEVNSSRSSINEVSLSGFDGIGTGVLRLEGLRSEADLSQRPTLHHEPTARAEPRSRRGSQTQSRKVSIAQTSRRTSRGVHDQHQTESESRRASLSQGGIDFNPLLSMQEMLLASINKCTITEDEEDEEEPDTPKSAIALADRFERARPNGPLPGSPLLLEDPHEDADATSNSLHLPAVANSAAASAPGFFSEGCPDTEFMMSAAHGVVGPLMREMQHQQTETQPQAFKSTIPPLVGVTESPLTPFENTAFIDSQHGHGLGLGMSLSPRSMPGGTLNLNSGALGARTPEEFGVGDFPKQGTLMLPALHSPRREPSPMPTAIEEGVVLEEDGISDGLLLGASASQTNLELPTEKHMVHLSPEKNLMCHRDSVQWSHDHRHMKKPLQPLSGLNHTHWEAHHMMPSIIELKIPRLPGKGGARTPRRLGSLESPAELSAHALAAVKRGKLPEIPRLRERFRDRRFILQGNWRNQVVTVKRFHLEVASRLGLSEEDWNWLGSIYEVNVSDLERAAERKEELERHAAAKRVQERWRVLREYRHAQRQRLKRRFALLTLQRWWHRRVAYRNPMQKRVECRPALLRAVSKIQARARGWRHRRRTAFLKDLHSVTYRLDCLRRHLGGDDLFQLIKFQAMVRGFLARRRYAKLKEANKETKEEDDKAGDLSPTGKNKMATRRMSFMHMSGLDMRRGTMHSLAGGSRLVARRASEMFISRDIGQIFQVESRPKHQTAASDENACLQLGKVGAIDNRLTRLEDGDSDDEDEDEEDNRPQSISERAVTATPLAQRLKRPLDPGHARMAGLQKGYVSVADEPKALKKASVKIERILVHTPREALTKRRSQKLQNQQRLSHKHHDHKHHDAHAEHKEGRSSRSSVKEGLTAGGSSTGNARKEVKVMHDVLAQQRPVPVLKPAPHTRGLHRAPKLEDFEATEKQEAMNQTTMKQRASSPRVTKSPRSDLTLSPRSGRSPSPQI